MQTLRRPEGSLVIRENPAVLQGILVALGAAVVAAVSLQEPRDDFRIFLGVLGSLVPFLGAALLERIHFEFDVARQRLRWRRRNLFRGRSGELAFGEIEGVELRVRQEWDRDVSRRRPTPTYCVALVTAAGDLRLSDRRYADERETSEIAEAIRAVLGVSRRSPVDDGIGRLMTRRPSHP